LIFKTPYGGISKPPSQKVDSLLLFAVFTSALIVFNSAISISISMFSFSILSKRFDRKNHFVVTTQPIIKSSNYWYI